MRIGFEGRVNILTAVTSLVVAYVRHGLETKWAPWPGFGHFFSSWFVHYIALWLLIVIAGATISGWHKRFLGDRYNIKQLQSQYYIVMTTLIAALTILILAVVPFSSSDE